MRPDLFLYFCCFSNCGDPLTFGPSPACSRRMLQKLWALHSVRGCCAPSSSTRRRAKDATPPHPLANLRPVREMQGMRNGMTPRKTIQSVVSFQGTPWFIPSFPTEHQQEKGPKGQGEKNGRPKESGVVLGNPKSQKDKALLFPPQLPKPPPPTPNTPPHPPHPPPPPPPPTPPDLRLRLLLVRLSAQPLCLTAIDQRPLRAWALGFHTKTRWVQNTKTKHKKKLGNLKEGGREGGEGRREGGRERERERCRSGAR